MADDERYTATLTELDSIANAAMTEAEREKRAAPVLDKSRTHVNGLCTALTLDDLDWNVKKASASGINLAHWQEALDVAGLAECGSLGELLRVIHRAEAAATMLRAGYKPERDVGGTVGWRR